MNENKLTSYNFLATLTENGEDLISAVYIPICKRALSSFSQKRQEYGTDVNIQEEINSLYGINVPITLIRQLIKASAKSFSRKEKSDISLEIFENGKCFKMKLFSFNKYEKIYSQLAADSELLQKAFEYFYKENIDEDVSNIDSIDFVDFLDKNKNKLSHFFAGKKINGADIEKSYLPHIQFIEYLEISNRYLYDLAEKIYFGSVIAGFLESGFDLDAKFLAGEEYYVDTQLILRALDLQNEADTQSAKELLELIHKLNGKTKYLGITLSEISHIIEIAIENYNRTTPTTTVNEACLRLGRNKSWLINFNSNIQENISKMLGLELEIIPKEKIQKYKNSPDIKELQGTRKNSANAEHDVFAYLHIREKRDTLVRSFQKAKYWFVTANKNLYEFNISKNPTGVVSEIILPDTLTSLLWLKGNRKIDKAIRKIGLSELMLQTFHEEIASKELINDFHLSVKENTEINDNEYEILLSSVAHQSAKKLQKLIELSEESKQRFNEKVHQIIAKERDNKKRDGQLKKDTLEILEKKQTEKLNAEKRISEIEEQLKLNSQKNIQELESLKAELSDYRSVLNNQNSELAKLRNAIFIFIISLILLAIVYFSINVWNFLKISITAIAGLGGFWGFINLIINLLKLKINK